MPVHLWRTATAHKRPLATYTHTTVGPQVGLFGPDTTAAVNGSFSSAVLSDCFTQTNGVYK
jgi:hypothetical protein